jgi:hypothetical protein
MSVKSMVRAVTVASSLAVSGCLLTEQPVIVDGTRWEGLTGRYAVDTPDFGDMVVTEGTDPRSGGEAYRVAMFRPGNERVGEVLWVVLDPPRDGRAVAQYRAEVDDSLENGILILERRDTDTWAVMFQGATLMPKEPDVLLASHDVTMESFMGLSVELKGDPEDVRAVLRELARTATPDEETLVLTRMR